MTIEEKAKAYDEALERAKAYHRNELAGSRKEMTEYIFPQLRESEDEMTRNEIIAFIEQAIHRGGGTPISKEKEDKWLAYLEKQKEQKSIESVAAEVTKDKESAIKFLKSAGIMDDNGELAEMYRSEQKPAEWSEEDERIKHALIEFLREAYSRGNAPEECAKWIVWLDQPKEQSHDGKKWIYEDDYHKDMERSFNDGKDEVLENPEKYGLQKEQKPAEWSEKDERILTHIQSHLKYLTEHRFEIKDYNTMEDRMILESEIEWLKNRFKSLRPSWKPSEDEERLINTSISFLKDFADKGYENAVECIDWLKSKL